MHFSPGSKSLLPEKCTHPSLLFCDTLWGKAAYLFSYLYHKLAAGLSQHQNRHTYNNVIRMCGSYLKHQSHRHQIALRNVFVTDQQIRQHHIQWLSLPCAELQRCLLSGQVHAVLCRRARLCSSLNAAECTN